MYSDSDSDNDLSNMDKLNFSRKIVRSVYDLESKTKKLEEMCKVQEAKNQNLSREFAASREENDKLQRRLSRIEQENMELKLQLAAYKNQAGAGETESRKLLKKNDGVAETKKNGSGRGPLDIFPEEIWIIIFEHLKEAVDLKSCYYTCTYFQSILQEQRKFFLFEDVIRILAKRNKMLKDSRRRIMLYPILMKCRLVCYSWRQSVDNFLQGNSPIFPQDNSFDDFFPASKPALVFKSEKNPWNDPVMRTMNSEENPLASRFLIYNDNVPTYRAPPNAQETLRNKFIAFLSKFGHHVWYFRVEFSREKNKVDSTAWYNLLLGWLSHMPNLKGLEIHKPGYEWYKTPVYIQSVPSTFNNPHGIRIITDSDEEDVGSESDDSDSYSPSNKRRLEWINEEIARYAFPEIKSLTMMVFEDCPSLLMESALNSNPQIQRLNIKRWYENKSDLDMNSIKLDKLQELGLIYRGSSCSHFEKTTWPVSKLSLDVPKVSWTKLFQVLGNCFGNTLIDLNLMLHGPCNEHSPRLHLPNLRTLKMKIERCFNSIDFILPLTNMEFLSVDLSTMYQNRDKWEEVDDKEYIPLVDIIETIKFHQFTHDLKNSNIWALLPKLKKITTRTDRNIGDEWDDGVTPRVDDNWQCCTRDQLGV